MAAVAVAVAVAVVTDMICDNANRLLLQFHITGRCNLRCKHCYRTEGNVEPLSTEDVLQIIDQFAALQQQYNKLHNLQKKGHINITGGEPFMRQDIDQILHHLGSYRNQLSFGILSNGSFLNKERIATLKENGVSFVQLSIDGDRATHDSLRAPGDYDRTFQTAHLLEQQGVRTYISFTANRNNYHHLTQVARECRKHRITKLWTDRLVPIGTGEQLQNLAITSAILPDYLKTLKKAQGSWLTRLLYPKTQVTANRALQFLGAQGQIYSCSAGNSLITVDEFGQIMPCRRMPILCGNVLEQPLDKVYFESEVFLNLRKKDIPKACSQCAYHYYCRGGAKCQAHATCGTYHQPDPACPFVAKT